MKINHLLGATDYPLTANGCHLYKSSQLLSHRSHPAACSPTCSAMPVCRFFP